MRSYIIRLSTFPNSVEWAKKAYNSGKQHNWDIDYFEGVNGLTETLEDYNISANKKYKKSIIAFKRPGTVGCFLSHYKLWQRCIDLNEPICVLEHDVTIHDFFPNIQVKDVVKLSSGPKAKSIYIGEWWSGAMAYCISPQGAKKLIEFVRIHGAMPADVMLCNGIVDLNFYDPINTVVTYVTDKFSFTWDL